MSDEPDARVSGRDWHHLQQEQPAGEAINPKFQGGSAELGELTGVPVSDA
ncbi:hypothetical protein [Bradyrhizobium ottawaense]